MITTTPRMTEKAITTTRRNPSGTKPDRFIASDGDANRVRVSLAVVEQVLADHGTPAGQQRIEDQHLAAASALCVKMGWKGKLVSGWLKPGSYVHVFAS